MKLDLTNPMTPALADLLRAAHDDDRGELEVEFTQPEGTTEWCPEWSVEAPDGDLTASERAHIAALVAAHNAEPIGDSRAACIAAVRACEESSRSFETAVETAGPEYTESGGSKARQRAMTGLAAIADTAYEDARDAIERGDLVAARAELETARRVESDAGDDSDARRALAALAALETARIAEAAEFDRVVAVYNERVKVLNTAAPQPQTEAP